MAIEGEATRRHRLVRWLPAWGLFLVALGTCPASYAGHGPPATSATISRLVPRVVATRPHDPRAFTQGLQLHEGILYESTGLHGESSVRRFEASTLRELGRRKLDAQYFGEGLTLVENRLILLTWRSGIALVYDAKTFTEIKRFTYSGEGWGLTFDGLQLIQSDGSSRLYFRDPFDFSLQGSVEVTLDGQKLDRLNELEFVDGKIYANIWGEEWLVRIDPTSGKVDAIIDARRLLSPDERQFTDVLNGIAWDARNQTFLLTGKFWPKLFEVKLEKAP